ncbi:hypothetical protein I4U23_000550 [Adineta vaga]|nr:hypothetical protein I4U23_000550 [Adineta vaga]
MHSQLVVVLLVGLAASAYALDLSHADKRSLQTEPRLFGFLNEFYTTVVYPPLNHVVTNLALLGAQFLAGVSEVGIPAPGGRMLHPSEAQLRGFFDELWNNVVKPPLENALSGVSLLAAQVLAGLGTNGVNLGKRDLTEAEARDFFDALSDAFSSVYSNVIQKPLENALSGGALMLAQVLAGMGTNGVSLSSLFGKRDLTEAEARDFFDALSDAFSSVFNNVIQKPLEDALSGGALMLAQVLAGMGTNGVSLSSLFGKRDLSELSGRADELRGFFDTLGQGILNGLQSVWSNVLQSPVESALQSGALMAAQVLAGLGTNGVNLGKREARGVLSDLTAHASNLIQTQVKPIVENALAASAIHLAGVLANFSQNGFGRR